MIAINHRDDFEPTLVRGSGSARITMDGIPDDLVPVWFEIPDDVASKFLVAGIESGKGNQLISTGCLPAELFARSSPRDELLLDGSTVTQHAISIDVVNLTDEDRVFSGRPVLARVDRAHPPSRRLDNARRAIVCGLGHTLVKSYGSARVVVQPNAVFFPDRLFVPRSSIDSLLIEKIEVCRWSIGDGPIFSHVLTGVSSSDLHPDNLRRDGCFESTPRIGVDSKFCFVLSVRNLSGRSAAFTGAILGARS